jgi:hypothetical protein
MLHQSDVISGVLEHNLDGFFIKEREDVYARRGHCWED